METTTDRDEPTKADLTVSGIPGSDFTMIESTGTMGLGQWVQQSLYERLCFPFWKHLDDRGFGTAQPFICWLLIPFSLSMIVWYYSVMELIELANWEAEMGPMPIFPVTEDFTWGEL